MDNGRSATKERCNDSYKLRGASLYLAYFIGLAELGENRPARTARKRRSSGNEVEIVFRRRDEKPLAAEAAFAIHGCVAVAFVKLGSTSTYTSPVRVLLAFRVGGRVK